MASRPIGQALRVAAWFVLAVAAPCSSPAQTPTAAVSGSVVDARTRQPLSGAVVEVVDPALSATTGADGRFRLDHVPIGPHRLLVSLVGYGLETRDLDVPPAGLEIDLVLTEGMAAFTAQVIVEGRGSGAREAAAGQQSLNSAELRQLGGMTLDDPLRAVQALAGANASDDLSGEFAVRGSGFRRVSYTLDGVPARFLLHTVKFVRDGGSVSMINSDVLDRATLLRGGYPQRLDPRLGAGLVFESSDGSRARTRVNVTASGTSLAVTADGPMGRAHRATWLVSARRSYLDVFLHRVLHDSTQAFGFSDLFSKVAVEPSPRHQMQATVVVGRASFQQDHPSDAAALARARHVGWLATTAWQYTPTPGTVITQRAFATGESYANRTGADAPVADGRATQAGYRLDLRRVAGGALVEAGGSVERLTERQRLAFQVPGWDLFGGEDFTAGATRLGAYGLARWFIGALTVSPGARVDRVSLVPGAVVSPWLQVEWRRASAVGVVFNAGLRHQFPEINELVGRRGQPGLRPERAMPVDVGVDGRLTPTLQWSATIYARSERDVVDLPEQYLQVTDGQWQPQSTTSRYDNRLAGSSRGVEVALRRQSPTGGSGWIAYSLAHTTYRDAVTGERFDGDEDQRHTLSLFGRYRVSSRTSVNARWRFGSNRPFAGYLDGPAGGPYLVTPTRNVLRVPAYSRLDARVDHTYQRGRSRITLFAEVANLLNRTNVRQVPPYVDFSSGEAFGLFQRTFPWLPSLGATLEF